MNLFGLNKQLKNFNNKEKDKIANMLNINKDAYLEFENKYKEYLLKKETNNFFKINTKQMANEMTGILINCPEINDIIDRIVFELMNKTIVWNYNGKNVETNKFDKDVKIVSKEDILSLPEKVRPQLTGSLYMSDIEEPSCTSLLSFYNMFLNEKNPNKKMQAYNIFRQGLDILDLDDITYKIIGTNPNSMGFWLPKIVDAIKYQSFFKIPNTSIIKVPLPLLQLTRLAYDSLTRTTLDIVDKYCYNVFNLKNDKNYFIKTGTYSSKFDFRNAKVTGEKEVRELGEYLLFIHHQALQMASPLNNVSIYGVSTTNEWVVRDFIEDREDNPCIYKGLPLHTEYRIFVDFDTKEIIGYSPYWEPDTMTKRFGEAKDSNNPDMIHDYIIYKKHEDTLAKRYAENIEKVKMNLLTLIENVEGITGQWSMDIMQNENDFWIIDMALAINSALNNCVPREKLKPIEENWIPEKEVL